MNWKTSVFFRGKVGHFIQLCDYLNFRSEGENVNTRVTTCALASSVEPKAFNVFGEWLTYIGVGKTILPKILGFSCLQTHQKNYVDNNICTFNIERWRRLGMETIFNRVIFQQQDYLSISRF